MRVALFNGAQDARDLIHSRTPIGSRWVRLMRVRTREARSAGLMTAGSKEMFRGSGSQHAMPVELDLNLDVCSSDDLCII